jgi:hypothetical protein
MFTAAALAAGSAHGVAQEPARSSGSTTTFSEHVAPIVFKHCTSCHRPGEAAPFPLTTFAEARPMGRRIAAVARSRQMPPWKAAPSDFTFANARGLSEMDITTLERWAADGLLEGDRRVLPPLPQFTEGWQLGAPDLVVKMAEPFDVPATGRDVYRSFVVPLNVDRDTWVRAVDFRPSARSVVHHSLFFLDATRAARERDELDPLPGFEGGMGGARLIGAGRGRGGLAALVGLGRSGRAQDAERRDAIGRAGGGLGGWALGGRALELPPGLAFLVPKGADLVLSTHFHPSGRAAREQSTVGLYFSEKPPTQAFAGIQLPPAFGLFEGVDIPAGADRYTIADTFTLPIDVRAFQVGAHAHYLGKEMKLTATLPDGSVKTLLWIKDWDFSWQEQYRFADFVSLPKGTRLDATVSYDNSAANVRNPSRPPVRVSWGEESSDEMGSIGLQVVAANRGELPQLQQAYAEHVREAALSGTGLQQLLRQRR